MGHFQQQTVSLPEDDVRSANDNSDFPVLTAEELELFFRGEAILDLLHCSSLEARQFSSGEFDGFDRKQNSGNLLAMEAMAHRNREFSH